MFRYRLVQNFAGSKVKLAIGQVSAESKVSWHPLFQQAQRIPIKKDELNLKCLQLLQNGLVQITPEKSVQFVKRCREVFQIRVQLAIEEVGINLLISNNDQDVKNLEFLEFGDLLMTIKMGFDRTPIKLHPKIMRKLKNYAQNSKRSQGQKDILFQILKSLKESQKLQDYQQGAEQTKQKVTSSNDNLKKVETLPKTLNSQNTKRQIVQENNQQLQSKKDKRKNQRMMRAQQQQDNKNIMQQTETAENNYQDRNYLDKNASRPKWQNNRGNNRNNNRSNDRRSNDRFSGRGQSTGKDKFDPKIMLGISGDTESGWRQRNRPARIPQKSSFNEKKPKQYKMNYPYKVQEKYETKKGNQRVLYNGKRQNKNQYKKQNKTNQLQNSQNNLIIPNQVVQKKRVSNQPAKTIQNGTYTLIFEYPQDGKSFNFKKLKDDFRLYVNNNFWISFNKNQLQIKKGQNGYSRDSKIDVIENGIMAQGLTLRLQGGSNIEDGGDSIGNPNIKQFTGSQKQFFHVNTLQIYVKSQQYKQTQDKLEHNKSENTTKISQEGFKQAEQQCQQKDDQMNQWHENNQQLQDEIEPYQLKRKSKKSYQTNKPNKKNMKGNQRQEQQFDLQAGERKMSNVSSNNSKKNKKQDRTRKGQKQSRNNNQQQQNEDDWQDVQENISNRKLSNSKGQPNKKKARKVEQFNNNKQQKFEQNRQESRNYKKSSRSRSASKSDFQQKGKSKDKIKYDPKILLGINGSSEAGWRQINRPVKVPAKQLLEVQDEQERPSNKQKIQKREKSKSKSKKKYAEKEESQSPKRQVDKQPSNTKNTQQTTKSQNLDSAQYQLIFSYPKDGKTFDFEQIKQNFKAIVNSNFQILFKNGQLEIRKGENGYIRQSKIDVMKNAIMAQGLTLNLDGSSNIEDGGQSFGDPKIEDFTKNKGQFFHIDTLQIYAPKK